MNEEQWTKFKVRLMDAVEAENLSEVKGLVGLWDEAELLDRKLAERLSVSGESQQDTNGAPESKVRKFHIEITDGAIRQSYLSLSRAVAKGLMKRGEELEFEIPLTGAVFRSDVTRHGKILRERKAIGQFYQAAKVAGGEYVVLTQTAPGRWKIEVEDVFAVFTEVAK